MFSAILYYILIFPISRLPLWLIYLIADVFYFLLRTVFPYRKKVIIQNLQRSFPDKSQEEIHLLSNHFYRHLADLMAEGIKNLSISQKELSKRVVADNPELLEKLYKKGKSVILVAGHYNNWEWMITSQNHLFPHQAIGIGKPLSNGFWDKKLNQLRGRYGMIIAHAKNFKDILATNKNTPVSLLVLTDQSPTDSGKSYWLPFLNQQTPVLFGAEMMAFTYDFPVVYYTMKKVKRGYYRIILQTITEDPRQTSWGEITEAHTRLLEKDILDAPEYWLWSHKRWKRDVPSDLEALKSQQKQNFEKKFGRV
ncbi:MAG: lysophospholipid acyltransferase family protein [Saprospiraceae bacterium]|nr:lysophospholipid acyltransferase family protein [Saprospiraceae bacterium]